MNKCYYKLANIFKSKQVSSSSTYVQDMADNQKRWGKIAIFERRINGTKNNNITQQYDIRSNKQQ